MAAARHPAQPGVGLIPAPGSRTAGGGTYPLQRRDRTVTDDRDRAVTGPCDGVEGVCAESTSVKGHSGLRACVRARVRVRARASTRVDVEVGACMQDGCGGLMLRGGAGQTGGSENSGDSDRQGRQGAVSIAVTRTGRADSGQCPGRGEDGDAGPQSPSPGVGWGGGGWDGGGGVWSPPRIACVQGLIGIRPRVTSGPQTETAGQGPCRTRTTRMRARTTQMMTREKRPPSGIDTERNAANAGAQGAVRFEDCRGAGRGDVVAHVLALDEGAGGDEGADGLGAAVLGGLVQRRHPLPRTPPREPWTRRDNDRGS